MGRLIGSVVAGYVVMFAVVFLLMTAAWMVLGADGAFQPGNWDVTGTWALLSVGVGLVAAVGGGYLCATIARDPRGPLWLIGVTLILGIVLAIPVLTGGDATATPRPDDLSMGDAMTNAVQPAWTALLNPIIGAVGVWLGARLKGRPTA